MPFVGQPRAPLSSVTALVGMLPSILRKLDTLHEFYQPNFFTMTPEQRTQRTEKMKSMGETESTRYVTMGSLIRSLEADFQYFNDLDGRSDEILSRHCSTCITNLQILKEAYEKDGQTANFTDETTTLTSIVSQVTPITPAVTGDIALPARTRMAGLLAQLQGLTGLNHIAGDPGWHQRHSDNIDTID